jgi:hypothetical protein
MDECGMTSFCLGGSEDTLGYHAPPDDAAKCFRGASSFRVVVHQSDRMHIDG